jgi:hypothetical protein
MFDIIIGWYVSISCWLRKQLFIFQVHSHVPEKQQSSLQSNNFWKSKASVKGESIFLHCTHPWTHVGLEMMPCDVASFSTLYLVLFYLLVSRLSGTSFSVFKFVHTYLFRFLEISAFGASDMFCFYQLSYVSSSTVRLLPQHWTFFLHCNYLFFWHS